MLVASMVDHKIHHELDTTCMKSGYELIHVLEGAERWMYVFVVGDVVALIILSNRTSQGDADTPYHVDHRALVDRRQPDHVLASLISMSFFGTHLTHTDHTKVFQIV